MYAKSSCFDKFGRAAIKLILCMALSPQTASAKVQPATDKIQGAIAKRLTEKELSDFSRL